MADFSETVAAKLAGRDVRVAHLVKLEFASGTQRVWTGFGTLTAGAQTWEGIGDAGKVGSLNLSPGLNAEAVKLTLSGLSATLVAIAKDQVDEVVGRRVTVYLQFFGDGWEALDSPYAVFVGLMDKMERVLTATDASIEVNCESIMTFKHRPPYGNFSHFDQQQRYSGDLGLERMAHNVDHVVNWP